MSRRRIGPVTFVKTLLSMRERIVLGLWFDTRVDSLLELQPHPAIHPHSPTHSPRCRGPRGFTFTWWGCCDLCQRHKPAALAHSFLLCSCVYFGLSGPFNCIFSTIYLFMKISLSPGITLCGARVGLNIALHTLPLPGDLTANFLPPGSFNFIFLTPLET